MLTFFRRALSSWVMLAIFGLVLIAFAVTSIDPSWISGIGGARGTEIAKVGGDSISTADIRRRVDSALREAQQRQQQEQPGGDLLDMAAFVSGGGFDQVVGRVISGQTLESWGRKIGLTASDRLIDGEIASNPAFFGLTGKFDRGAMEQVLGQLRISERQMRADIAGDAIRRQILLPAAAGAVVPDGLVIPATSVLLEQRGGLVAVVPTTAIPTGPAPTAAEIAAYYKANIARFTIPERRVLRYALFGADSLPPIAAPTEAEIAAFYKANAATYAASETRAITQVILPDQKAAEALAVKVRGGAGVAEAAKAAGGDAVTLDIAKARLAENASPAIADAVFGLAQGGIAGPIKADLGWYVVKLDAVHGKPGRSLAEARGEIADALAKQKHDQALSDLVTKMEDSIADGASFDDVVKANQLTAVTTPALLPDGRAPDQADFKPAPELAVLLRSAQQMSGDDDPSVETIGAGQRYALLAVSRVVAATPAPIERVQEEVAAAIQIERNAKRARAIADAILAKAKAGTPLAQAVAQAGVSLPAPTKAAARQIDLMRRDRQAPPPLQLMFAMKKGETRLIAAPNNGGWFVVQLDSIVPGDGRAEPALANMVRRDFSQNVGEEYIQQLINAAAKDVNVRRNDKAIAALKAELSGQGQ